MSKAKEWTLRYHNTEWYTDMKIKAVLVTCSLDFENYKLTIRADGVEIVVTAEEMYSLSVDGQIVQKYA